MGKYKQTGNPMGRPRIDFDPAKFERMCSYMCTEEEIAGIFGCSVDTVENRCKEIYGETFSEVFKRFSAGGKLSLRRAQFRMAEKNATMAIWLGKQYLGQRESIEFHDDEALDKLDEVLSAVKAEAEDAEVLTETE